MKLFILVSLFIWSSPIFSQYSNYYSNIYIGQSKKSQNKVDVNANINQNINANINVSGTIVEQKHITTIDYGALELSYVQKERNRLELQKYTDLREKEISESIARNPIKAYEYGYPYRYCMKDLKKFDNNAAKKWTKETGIKDFCINFVISNNKLFSNVGPWKFQNVSDDGVIVDIEFMLPNFFKGIKNNLDSIFNYEQFPIGEEINGFFYHKKDKRPADVFGSKGIKATLITEDKYELQISDVYTSHNYNHELYFTNTVLVNYHGDKKEVTFEQLEGRKYYFRNLIQKLIATASVDKIKY
jgi:hypothetical protein